MILDKSTGQVFFCPPLHLMTCVWHGCDAQSCRRLKNWRREKRQEKWLARNFTAANVDLPHPPPHPPKIERLQFNSVYLEHQTSCLNLHPIISNWYLYMLYTCILFMSFPCSVHTVHLIIGFRLRTVVAGNRVQPGVCNRVNRWTKVCWTQLLNRKLPELLDFFFCSQASLRVHWFWTTSWLFVSWRRWMIASRIIPLWPLLMANSNGCESFITPRCEKQRNVQYFYGFFSIQKETESKIEIVRMFYPPWN